MAIQSTTSYNVCVVSPEGRDRRFSVSRDILDILRPDLKGQPVQDTLISVMQFEDLPRCSYKVAVLAAKFFTKGVFKCNYENILNALLASHCYEDERLKQLKGLAKIELCQYRKDPERIEEIFKVALYTRDASLINETFVLRDPSESDRLPVFRSLTDKFFDLKNEGDELVFCITKSQVEGLNEAIDIIEPDKIYLDMDNLLPREAEAILKELQPTNNLRVIDLRNGNLTENAIEALARIIGNIEGLKSLTLNKCGLRKEGISLLIEALEKHKIVELDLSSNDLEEDEVLLLTEWMQKVGSIRLLNISNNRLSSQSITTLLANSDFEKINLEGNYIGDDVSFIQTLIQKGVKSVNLAKNNIAVLGMKRILNCLEEANQLQLEEIDLRENLFSERMYDQIKRKRDAIQKKHPKINLIYQ